MCLFKQTPRSHFTLHVFVQANSIQDHIWHYIMSFWVMFSLSTVYFWLARKTENNKLSTGSKMSWREWQLKKAMKLGKRFLFLPWLRCSVALPTTPPCYAGYFLSKLYNLFWEFVVTLITNQSILAIHVLSFFLFLTCSWCCYSLPIWIGQLQLLSPGVHFCKLK